MKKNEILKLISKRLGIQKNTVEDVLETFLDIARQELENGGEIPIPPLGRFKVQKYKERNSRNPKTGESIIVPAKNKVVFKQSKFLKESVAGLPPTTMTGIDLQEARKNLSGQLSLLD